jgi:hypothetical protein
MRWMLLTRASILVAQRTELPGNHISGREGLVYVSRPLTNIMFRSAATLAEKETKPIIQRSHPHETATKSPSDGTTIDIVNNQFVQQSVRAVIFW